MTFEELLKIAAWQKETTATLYACGVHESLLRLQAADSQLLHLHNIRKRYHDVLLDNAELQFKLDELYKQEPEPEPAPIKRGPFESLAEFQGKHRFKTSEPMQHYQRRASDIKVGDL